MANTLSLMQNKIVMELSGWYQFPLVQGIYDVGAMCSVSMGLVWRTNIKGLSFAVKYEDVFDTYRMKVSTDVSGQKYAFKNNVDERCLSINVKYNFNGYKGKNKETSTDDRLGL